jgi:hypothetical protein
MTRERRSSLKRPEIHNEFRTPPSTDRIASRDRVYPMSAHPLDQKYSSRLSGVRTSNGSRSESKDVLGDSPSLSIKKVAETNGHHSRLRSSNLGTNGTFHSSPITARHGSIDQEPSPPLPRAAEGTESTVSTTAPSTVWDELDDLKSRIRKLELTGRMPGSSSAAVTGATERPRTAATTATTMSASPKRSGGKSTSPTNSGFEEASPHPLLNSALSKAKEHLTAETYQALEATALDALTLAKMSSVTSPQGTPSAIDRQLKRKADNMCRSLTELCLALTKGVTTDPERAQSRARSASRDGIVLHQPPVQSVEQDEAIDRRFQRARSLDPEPTASQRVLSRLEARRTSMLQNLGSSSVQASPKSDQHMEVKTPTQATLSRTSTVLQRIRRNEDLDNENTIRPISRANTELARANTVGSGMGTKRVSREYTSNYPLPSPEARNLAIQTHLPGRRSYLSGGGGIVTTSSTTTSNRDKDLPITPTTPGFSGRRYLSRPGDEGGNSSRLTEPRQRLVSAGQTVSGIGRSVLALRSERKSAIGAGGTDMQ